MDGGTNGRKDGRANGHTLLHRDARTHLKIACKVLQFVKLHLGIIQEHAKPNAIGCGGDKKLHKEWIAIPMMN